jgi:hypothetical protein
MGKATVVREFLFGLDWRRTTLIVGYPYQCRERLERANKVGSSTLLDGAKAES